MPRFVRWGDGCARHDRSGPCSTSAAAREPRWSLVLHSVSRVDAVGILREAARVLVADGRMLVVDFGTSGLRFPRGWMGRGITVIAELAAGPRHAANSLDYLRRGGLPALVAEAGLELRAVRPTAGGAIVIAVLGRTRPPGAGR